MMLFGAGALVSSSVAIDVPFIQARADANAATGRVVPEECQAITFALERGRPLCSFGIDLPVDATIGLSRSTGARLHCAFIQFSDPVILTDTSEREIRTGFPSAVPR